MAVIGAKPVMMVICNICGCEFPQHSNHLCQTEMLLREIRDLLAELVQLEVSKRNGWAT